VQGIELKPGDVMLLPTQYTEVYTIIQGVLGGPITSLLPRILNEPYLHAEIYIGSGFSMAAWTSGIHVHKYPLSVQMKFDFFRHKNDKASEAIKDLMVTEFVNYLNNEPVKYLNKRYDFSTLFYNTIAELTQVLGYEQIIETKTPRFDTPEIMICSELIARMYQDAGYDLKVGNPEWVSPADLAESPMLYKVI